MKIIHKSILKELIIGFVLSLVSLNFILMLEKLLRLSRLLSGVGTSIVDMVRLILYIQPQLFIFTIPMALLLSTLLIYGRLNVDSELVILRMSGMHFRDLSMPVVVLGLLCFLLNLAVSFYVGPKSGIKLRDEIANIIRERAPLAIEEGRFNNSFKGAIIFVKRKPADNVSEGIFIYDNRNKEEPRVLLAKQGIISTQGDSNIDFLLEDGYINMSSGENTTEVFFKKYNMVLKLDLDTPAMKKAYMTPFELVEKIKESKGPHELSLYLELHRRFSLPFLCVILIFFGPPLSMMAGRTGKLGGLTMGLAVFTVYYMLLIYGENLVKANQIPYYVGAWSPTVILGLFAFFLFRKECCR